MTFWICSIIYFLLPTLVKSGLTLVLLCVHRHTHTKSLGMLPAEEIKAGQEATNDVFIAPQANKASVTFVVLRI